MDDTQSPPLAAPRRDPVWAVAAGVAFMAAAACALNAIWREVDVGLTAWNAPGIALIGAATTYLLLTGLAHSARATGPAITPRGELWLAILMLVLAWTILARGTSSRLLLAGLAPTISALAAAAGVSLLAVVREKLILRPPAPGSPPRDCWHLNAWRCLAAACVLLGVLYLETRTLPELKPWEQRPIEQAAH